MTMHLIKDTSFIYEKLGSNALYGNVARIGVIDKDVVMDKISK